MTTADERAARLERAIRLKRAAARAGAPELPPRPPDEPARLGEAARGLWLLQQLEPLSAAYNLTAACSVHGPLDAGRLQRALDQVVGRHRILRSTFRRHGGAVLQEVDRRMRPSLEAIEVEAGEARAAAVERAQRPFDLAAGPLVRLLLIEERPAGERLLLLVLHHVLADERSLELLWEELAEAYGGRPRPAPAVQYDDYVHWSRRHGRNGREAALEFWRRRLDPPPGELALPFAAPAGEAAGAPGRLLLRPAAPAVLAGVRRLAAATGVSPFTVYAFTFRVLLGRYTGRRRVAFGTPVSIRSHPATAEMVGYLLNPLVIVGELDEQVGVERAVRRFGAELRQMLAHGAAPFQRLAEELAPPRAAGRHPLFQAMLVHRRQQPPPPLGDARLEPLTLDLGESKFDLTLFVGEGEESLEVAVEYRTDLFEAVWMERLLDHYETLLARLPEEPGGAVAEVSLLGEEEARRLEQATTGAAPRERGELLPQRILEQARQAAAVTAAVCGGERWSYAELAAAGRAIAAALVAAGVRPGDRVGLFVERSPWMIAGILGSHWAGAAYVPLDPEYPPARNRLVLEDAEVAAVLTTAAARDRLPEGPWPALAIDAPPPARAGAAAAESATPESVAYLLYTSGSSGRPKGVVVTHGNLRASTAARLQAYEVPPRRFLLLPSVAFDSSVAGIFWTLATGGTLVIPTDEEAGDPRRLAGLVARERVSCLLCVPSLWERLLAAGGERLGGLDSVIVAGESCPSQLVARHFGALPRVRLFNEYGPTEATVWATVEEVAAADAARPVAIGRPIPGVRVEVLDGRGRPLPAGVPGEAWIGGPTVARGYWRRPELTAERFFEDGAGGGTRRYRTGDRVVRAPDGRLLFLGRMDEQIKLRGFRIEPGEVEAALLELPGVERAAVVARRLDGGPARPTGLVAFVEGTAGGEGWRERLARRLPRQLVPGRLVELPELPRLPNGKIDRGRLREVPLASEPAVAGPLPSDRELGLISLWEGLLGCSGIGVDDNFFELGGHSLLVYETAVAIERDFGAALTPAEVFENPTVRQLARRIEQRGGPDAPTYHHLYPIQPGGSGMPFIVAVPHFFTDLFADRFRDQRPVYGLRGVGLRQEGNLGRWRTMRQLGVELVAEIERRFPDETCIVAGYSFGASMAVEAVRLLEERGRPVHRLYLIAPMPLDIYRLGPLRLQLEGLDRPVEELSAGQALRRYARQNSPLSRGPYRRAWRRLAIEPWRRLLCLVGRLRRRAGLPLTPGILYADVRVDRFRLHARYRPGTVRTPTVLFNAREPETDAAATWRSRFTGPFTVVRIPDPHLDEASVEASRRLILEQLAELGDERC